MTLTGQAYRVIFKELKEQQESEFEQAFKKGIAKIQQNQTQESILVNRDMFQAEKLTLLSKSWKRLSNYFALN
ncbi:hypothetical protein [Mannheimia haemolytica]|uniref:hypothetical protein n=1 Tax=Mannheimia haemolytica TaxID=75985 RepID=UPI0031F51982